MRRGLAREPLDPTAMQTTKINRAPAMTLWAVVLAERLGYQHEEALTLGHAATGLNAYSKASAIGLVGGAEKEAPGKRPKAGAAARPDTGKLLGRHVPVVRTTGGVRGLAKDVAIEPAAVEHCLKARFKDSLPPFRTAMRQFAASRAPIALALEAYALYEGFRPQIRAAEVGRGKAGGLSVAAIGALAGRHRGA
jgi:hypothetical protein